MTGINLGCSHSVELENLRHRAERAKAKIRLLWMDGGKCMDAHQKGITAGVFVGLSWLFGQDEGGTVQTLLDSIDAAEAKATRHQEN